ncbi:MAG: TonB-dependent receptor [Desulfuromonadales bacterium]|nr:TonB-dependent receptor [Desulfuromonadales bacterium]
MNWKKAFTTVCTGYCCLSAGHVFAMGTPEEQSEDIFSLGEVVVSGKMDGIEAAETIHVISAEDIKKSSARTLDEALGLLSNVNVQVGNEGVPRVDMRGFRNRHVLFLLDGIPMNSAFDQNFDPSMIPVENIAKIKVTAGASSVLYGQGGLGGVVNIITKRGKKGLSGMAGFESGDGQPYLAKASLSGGEGKFDFFLSGSGFKRDNFPLAKSFTATTEEKAGYRKNSDNTRNNAFLNLGYTASKDLYIALTGNFVEGGYGKPASAIDNKFDPYSPPARFGRVDNYQGFTLQLAADYTPTANLSVRSMIFFNRMDQDDNQYDDENYGPISTGVLTEYTTNNNNKFLVVKPVNELISNSYMLKNTGITRGISIQPKYDMGQLGSVTMGFSAEWDTWDASGLVKPGGDGGAAGGCGVGGGSPPYNLFPCSDHKDLFISSAAIEYSVEPLENLGISLGYAHHWQFRDEANPEGYSVSASVYYDLFKDTRLKAAFQRNIRFPSLSQLYKRDSNNPNLIPETVYHYQMGIEQKLPWNSLLKLDGFRSDAHDFIALNQNVNPARNTNFSLYRFHGMEASIESNFMPKLSLKAGYTMLLSEDRSGVGRDEVQYTPRDKVSFVGKYDFDCGLTPFVSLIYVANSYVYTKQRIATVDKAKMSDYTVVNFKLSQKLFKDRLNLYIGADNIFNEDYEQSYGIPRPGRYIYGGFEYRFSL